MIRHCLALSGVLTICCLVPSQADAVDRSRVEAERLGLPSLAPAVELAERSYPVSGAIDVLLIPDSNGPRVMAFDPLTGDLLDANFIPADPVNLITPIQAILGSAGDTFLVSDQFADAVLEYELDGTFRGLFAPAGGVDPTILDNIRGIALRDNGHLLVAVAQGANDDAIAEFDTAGNYLGNFVANGEGGLNGPWGVLPDTSLYTTGDFRFALQEFDVDTGIYVQDLETVNNLPEQIAIAGNDNLLVADFQGEDVDIVEVARDGTRVGVYDSPAVSGARGVYELPNGNLLVTDPTGVYEIDRSGALLDTKISGVSARFITRATIGGTEPTLEVAGSCPGEVTVTVAGGTPGGTVGLLAGSGIGADTLDGGPCVGTQTDLDDVRLLATARLGREGELTTTRGVTDLFCGRSLQALDAATCSTSNVAEIP